MPVISRFYGIIIKLFYDDHQPAHFHVEYGEFRALITIDGLTLYAGYLPPRALGLVIEWASIHRNELKVLWNKAELHETLGMIEPLK